MILHISLSFIVKLVAENLLFWLRTKFSAFFSISNLQTIECILNSCQKQIFELLHTIAWMISFQKESFTCPNKTTCILYIAMEKKKWENEKCGIYFKKIVVVCNRYFSVAQQFSLYFWRSIQMQISVAIKSDVYPLLTLYMFIHFISTKEKSFSFFIFFFTKAYGNNRIIIIKPSNLFILLNFVANQLTAVSKISSLFDS